MPSFYRFPVMANLKRWTSWRQHKKIEVELEEARDAWYLYDVHRDPILGDKTKAATSRHDYGMELMDIIHATETALRMEFSDKEVEQLREDVIEKNRRRGYYGE